MSDDPALSRTNVPLRGDLKSAFGNVPLESLLLVGLPVAAAGAFLLGWQMIVIGANISPAILPAPTVVADQLSEHFWLIMKHAVPTTLETLLAFAISVPLGVLIAAVMIYSPLVNRALYPNIIFFQLIPKIALAPMFIVWLGIGLPSRVTFSIFISFFPILIATAAGLQSVNRDMLRLCRSVRATEWQVLVHVRFPMSLPYVFSGMKIAVTLSIIGIVVGEFIASQAGLGYLILFASSRQQTDLGLACIAVLCVVGLLLYGAVVLGERMMMKWYNSQ